MAIIVEIHEQCIIDLRSMCIVSVIDYTKVDDKRNCLNMFFNDITEEELKRRLETNKIDYGKEGY